MAYIWENYSSANEYCVGEGRDISPYFEILTESNAKMRVNPLIRFSAIFSEVFELKKFEINTSKVENILFHYLAMLDRIKGFDENELFAEYFDEEIRNGYYGKELLCKWDKISVSDRKKLLHVFKLKNSNDFEDNYFFQAIQKLFKIVSIIYEKNTKAYYLYIGENETKKKSLTLDVAKLLFWDIQCELRVIWKNHYGIIGIDDTMYISQITIV